MTVPKYALPEIERRWLAIPDRLPDLSGLGRWVITDTYLPDSRLRLRKMADPETGDQIYKFCKKYGKLSGITEPIVNIYLSEEEYRLLSKLPGITYERTRYRYPHQGQVFRINIGSEGVPPIVEAEFPTETEAGRCSPPPFCGEEISDRPEWEGPRLAERGGRFGI